MKHRNLGAAELMRLLDERSVELIDRNSIAARMASGRRIRVKLGIDPTAPHLHIGHMLPIRFLRAFQDAGHRAVLIIGDFTAQIGDPSGQGATRAQLFPGEVKRNERTYLRQVAGALDLRRAEVHHNSEWFGKMRLAEFLGLLTRFALKSAWEREDFQRRLGAGKSVRLHEAIYPVLQAFDSVAVRADIELGGADQRLNLLAGRELQSSLGAVAQDVVLLPYLIGIDGKEKMSKSVGNTINTEDSAASMFGKAMSIPDGLIIPYARLAAWLSGAEVASFKRALAAGANPRDAKLTVAEGIARLYHGAAAARKARSGFIRVFSKRDRTAGLPPSPAGAGEHDPFDLLMRLGVRSKAEARRLIAGRALEVDGSVIPSGRKAVTLRSGSVIRLGKKRFFRVP
ncbi:MAG: tyrosine--tRNA ligase [Candidatus Sungbacteria bacterium RIFCSPLOWO2_01_FULL_60_25]|uniref:Tyrosine--tRNA ligase n=1 Tax=Candidatus Sungbacteria bacterium RIFCSPLOWO2_01_FULL_60_25 TaxID=1802281 RepID=A0A1G2L9P4_9BACT|nr:MAG: tyrosine--tRNA ligase [Candidatus Sungbacteria bacterium RIFCSPLOWO2_01_FULL_60_25]